MSEFSVSKIHRKRWIRWVLETHYAHRVPHVRSGYGLFEDGVLCGVATYGVPASYTLCRGLCGVEFSKLVLELNRLVIGTETKNAASFLIGNSLKQLPRPAIVVSYADKNQGHVGYVYQATNWLYTGLGSLNEPRWILPDGTSFTVRRHIDEKVKRAGFQMSDVIRERRLPKHRYVFFCGNRRERRLFRAALRYPIESYPKGTTERYDCSPPEVKLDGFGLIE